jgi:hypothetical protein
MTMETKLVNIFALSIASLLVALSPIATAADPLDTPEIAAAAENVATQSDHEAVARHYEEAAAELQAKVAEKEDLLEHYEDKPYLYGRRAQDLQSHTHALIRDYKKTVKATMQAAAMHRQIAARLNGNHAANGTQTPDAVSGL